MKSLQRGYIVPVLVAVIAILIVGGGIYVYQLKKLNSPIDTSVQASPSNQVTQSPVASIPVNSTISNTPKPTQVANPIWKKYSDANISFEYPALVSLKQDAGTITLSHSIAHKHPNPCDFKGDAPPLDRLSDFNVSIKVVNQGIKDFVQSNVNPSWDFVSKNPFTSGSFSGYKVTPGIEGCGVSIYYLSISPDKTLVIHHSLVAEFNTINADYQKYLKLPGVISLDKREEYFNHILETLKFVNSSTPVVTLLSPNGGEIIKIGSTSRISWSSKDLNSSTITIRLKDESINCPVGILGCQNSFGINYGLKNTGSYSWDTLLKMSGSSTGPNSVNVVPGVKYKIEICKDGADICDVSNNYFTITN